MQRALITEIVLTGELANRLKVAKFSRKFGPGVNILCGPNGSGKSTLIRAVKTRIQSGKPKAGTKTDYQIRASSKFTVRMFDFEKDNPRTQFGFGENPGFQVASMFLSHGQVTTAILQLFATDEFKAACVLLDEPEQALDIDGIVKLAKLLKTTPASQVIIATHAPQLILDPDFTVVETVAGYRQRVQAAVTSWTKLSREGK